MYIYKLSFTDKEAYNVVIESLKIEDILPKEIKGIQEIRGVPIPAVIDPETQEEITPAGFHPDYAVDVVTEIEFDELKPFIIPAKEHYHHSIAGNSDLIIVKA